MLARLLGRAKRDWSGSRPTAERNAHLRVFRYILTLALRIFAIAQGYEDLNDTQGLREDTLFHLLCATGR